MARVSSRLHFPTTSETLVARSRSSRLRLLELQRLVLDLDAEQSIAFDRQRAIVVRLVLHGGHRRLHHFLLALQDRRCAATVVLHLVCARRNGGAGNRYIPRNVTVFEAPEAANTDNGANNSRNESSAVNLVFIFLNHPP